MPLSRIELKTLNEALLVSVYSLLGIGDTRILKYSDAFKIKSINQ